MKQNRKHSLIESIVQTCVGLVISVIIQIYLYSFLNIPVTFSQNILITAVFFVASIVRGYLVRRIFARL
jgi:hypothetical protein